MLAHLTTQAEKWRVGLWCSEPEVSPKPFSPQRARAWNGTSARSSIDAHLPVPCESIQCPQHYVAITPNRARNSCAPLICAAVATTLDWVNEAGGASSALADRLLDFCCWPKCQVRVASILNHSLSELSPRVLPKATVAQGAQLRCFLRFWWR